MSEVGNAIKDIIERLAGPYDISMFLKEQREFIEHHLDYLFRTFEGNACSNDKTRTIMGRLERFFESGVEIEFNYKEEYTYHMPKIILTTHDEIIVAYHALEYLFYGNPKKYLPLITEYSKKVLNDSSQDELTTLRAENERLQKIVEEQYECALNDMLSEFKSYGMDASAQMVAFRLHNTAKAEQQTKGE